MASFLQELGSSFVFQSPVSEFYNQSLFHLLDPSTCQSCGKYCRDNSISVGWQFSALDPFNTPTIRLHLHSYGSTPTIDILLSLLYVYCLRIEIIVKSNISITMYIHVPKSILELFMSGTALYPDGLRLCSSALGRMWSRAQGDQPCGVDRSNMIHPILDWLVVWRPQNSWSIVENHGKSENENCLVGDWNMNGL